MEQPRRQTSRTGSVMITVTTTVRMLAARRQAPGLAADITDLFRTLAKALFDPYRPELHYMRGPGPKWHAKDDPVCAPKAVAAMPAMIRCPLGPAHDDPRLPRSEPRAAIATLVSAKCDLIASILNPNRSFSATLCHKSEITGEFVLVFNKFGETIASKGDAPRSRWSKTGNRLRRKSTGGGHGKDNSKRCCPSHGTGRVGRSRRVRARAGQKPVRSIPARALLHARARS